MSITIPDNIEETVVYYVVNKEVFGFYKIGDYLIPQSSNVYKENKIKYDVKCTSKEDARYQAMLIQLKKGKTFDYYKRSKYYKYYYDRLQKENPEFLI